MPANSRRKSVKPAAIPLDLDEIEHDPGFRGMLSFLQVSPEEQARHVALKEELDRLDQSQLLPAGQLPTAGIAALPTGEKPMVCSGQPVVTQYLKDELASERPTVRSPVALLESTANQLPMGGLRSGTDRLAYEQPMGYSPLGLALGRAVPYIDVEGRGKRPLRYCKTLHDAHTRSEQFAYEALWAYSRRFGQVEVEGSQIVDIGLARLCELLKSDHKNVKRLLRALEEKLAVAVARLPDYKRGIPTRYRIFDADQVLDRRRRAGLVWVVRTRSTRFVDLDTVQRLLP